MTQTALSSLTQNTIDYAGLFPPAALPMKQVIENYAAYTQSAQRDMLGRLIIPAAKLSSLELPTNIKTAWRISALLPPCDKKDTTALAGGIELIKQFNQSQSDGEQRALVDAVEVKAPHARALHATVDLLQIPVSAFLEINWADDPSDLIAEIASANKPNIYAKIRTGGVTPDLIPDVNQVARFIHACAKRNVGFKATAGLHHPLRAEQNLTYQPDSPRAKMHGFLNVFVAAMFAFEHQSSEAILSEILSNEQSQKFGFADDHLKWGDQTVSTERISQIRNQGIFSFGSCSFTEPTIELAELAY